MGQIITLKAADGHEFSAYEAGHADMPYALVVVQEIFGVNSHIRHVCDTFAEHGFHVIAPALFDRAEPGVELGYEKADIQTGLALRSRIPLAETLLDLEAASAALNTAKVGILGYCWGGLLAWEAASQTNSFAVAVGWYGAGIAARINETPRCPVQLHFGEADTTIPHTDVSTIRSAHPEIEIYMYDGAGHGFGCSQRASFDLDAYELAQKRSVAFLEAHLRSHAGHRAPAEGILIDKTASS
ncbi:dienelactone hydrolase family protein [Acetobacter sp. P5B1]|uniref:dienelactone hydrolase family protein n=1 Tax=Acetobacter sp. P5B1 TaxID=2762620 RepID=UPI001C03E7C6|nr:dienelactone hydrolase family protein [Acetobacter sp. P5B1]